MKYKVLPMPAYRTAEGYAIAAIEERDMAPIKDWRNAQLLVLRQARPLTDADQGLYFAQHVLPAFVAEFPRIILFRFTIKDSLIGYGGLTNLDWDSRRAEVSFLLDPVRVADAGGYDADFSAFLGLLKLVGFGELGLNRLFTETYDVRPHHVAILERAGFLLEGRMRQHARVGGCLTDSLIHGLIKGQVDV